MRYVTIALGLTVLAGLSCERQSPQNSDPLGEVLGESPVSAQVQPAWGDIKGQVVWGGNGIPEVKELAVDKEKEHCLSKGPIPNEEWVINKENKGIRYAVVWLIPDAADGKLDVHPNLKDVPKKSALMDQPCCKFEPRVIAIRQGQVVEVKNSAPIAHNFKWAGIGNRGDNKLMPPGTSIKIDDLKAAKFPVILECNIHPWMKGYVRIFDHPYFAVTDENGNFEIKNAPAGKCRIVVWHEAGFPKDAQGNPKRDGDPLVINAGQANSVGKLNLP